jgi:hypothetical protein
MLNYFKNFVILKYKYIVAYKLIINKKMKTQETITNDLAGNFIAAMMDIDEFKIDLNFEQAKYLAAIMVTMQKHSIDEVLNHCNENKISINKTIEMFKTSSQKLENLHKLITCFKEENINTFNMPENNG